ncbi:MAG: hypothetical protein WAO09_07315, partial [Candidatus Dormiibacterota bacterium]
SNTNQNALPDADSQAHTHPDQDAVPNTDAEADTDTHQEALPAHPQADPDTEQAPPYALAQHALAQPVRQAHPDPDQVVVVAFCQDDSFPSALVHAVSEAIRRFCPEPSLELPHRRPTPGRLGAWRSKRRSRSI